MKKICCLLFASLLLLGTPVQVNALSTPCNGICRSWVQVNDGAFDLGPGPDGTYASDDGFEVQVFKNRLYVGMEADNTLGARLWRTKAGVTTPGGQSDWEEVAADASGKPFGDPDLTQNDHIDSLAGFNGYLYASTANRSGVTSPGSRLYRSPNGDPGTWVDVLATIGPGFGDPHNENFKDMQVFMGWLCGGTWNTSTGGQVWCSQDGIKWEQKSSGGFGDPQNITIWSGEVFQDSLYFGVQNTDNTLSTGSDDIGKLYKTSRLDGVPTWKEVYSGTQGSKRVDILGELNGYLYISTYSPTGILILRSASGEPGTWTQVNQDGMNGDANNQGTVVDGATAYNGALYVAVANEVDGMEVWRTTGIPLNGSLDWVRVGSPGLGDQNNILSELVPFNGSLYAWTTNYVSGQQVRRITLPSAQYVILMIGDGMGANQIQAADLYTGKPAVFESWEKTWVSTYPAGGSYDPAQAWNNHDYILNGPTDSAAAATALFTGVKTANGRISVSSDGSQRLFSIGDKDRSLKKALGAVTSVNLSDATPGAWYAHNASRTNGYAIADEGFWGSPNTTGSPGSPYYGGGFGSSLPPVDVLIGGGHPAWENGDTFVNTTQRDKLAAENGQPGAFNYVERISGSPDGGQRLLDAAGQPEVTRLAGLFGGPAGDLEYALADGSGANPEEPTLAEMTEAALTVLSRNPNGFTLLVEGGAIDHASHSNIMDRMVGEMEGFNAAVQAIIDWVNDPNNDSDWSNTLVIVTADHETGYLTAGPNNFSNEPFGPVNAYTLSQERSIGSGRRASWEDTNQNGILDPGEAVYWYWNSTGHDNNLVPLFVKGAGAELITGYQYGYDPVRGDYIDNTNVHDIIDIVTTNPPVSNLQVLLFLPVLQR